MKKVYTGNAVRTTGSTISNVATGAVLTLGASTNWPTTGPFVIVLEPGVVGKEEWVLCDSQAAGVVTINAAGRGYMGTPNVAHTNPYVVEPKCVDAIAIAELNTFVNLMTTKGDLVGFDGSNPVRIPAGTVDQALLRRLATGTGGVEWNVLGGITIGAPASPVDGQLWYLNSSSETEGLYAYDGTTARFPWNLPWGFPVQPVADAGASGPFSSVTDVPNATVTFTAVTRRWYRYVLELGCNNNGSIGAVPTTFQLCDGSNTILAEWYVITQGGGAPKNHHDYRFDIMRQESAGSVTRKIRCTGGGTGIAIQQFVPTIPTLYYVEDRGPVTGAPT